MMSTNELFAFLTRSQDWYEGYCTYNKAQVIKHRHKEGKLSLKAYEQLFDHFKYIPYWKKK